MAAEIDIGAEVDTPTGGAATEVIGAAGIEVIPLDAAQNAGDLEMAPVLGVLVVGSKTRRREIGFDAISSIRSL